MKQENALNNRLQPVSDNLFEKPKLDAPQDNRQPIEPSVRAEDLPPPEQLKAMDKKTGIVHLISGLTAKGEEFFAYVSVRPSQYVEFCGKLETGARIDVDSYGRVLQKGFGREPSLEVKKYMEQRFGIDPDFPEKVKEGLAGD